MLDSVYAGLYSTPDNIFLLKYSSTDTAAAALATATTTYGALDSTT
jgi:hypothetical protein